MHYLTKAALLAAVSLTAAPAFAESEDEAIVVTATRLANDAERLPADVDSIDVDQARSRGADTIAEALAESPGLDVVASGGFGQQTSLFSGGANSNHTLVLFDGVRLNDPASPGSSFDAGQDTLGGLQRIEIVQGPMSAIYGSDAIGGVINILPRRGRDGALNAELDVGAGSFDTLAATAAVDGTLGPLRYALSADAIATNGYDLVPRRMSTRTGDRDGAESSTFTGVFDLAFGEAFALDLLLRHREARADFDAFVYPPPSFNEQRVDDPDLEIAQNDLTVARLGATWRIDGGASLRASGGRLEQDREERDGGAATSSYAGERRFADLTIEWRGESISVAAGLETQTEQVAIDQGFAAVAAEQDQSGAFASVQGALGALTLTGAARVDDFEGFGAEATWRLGASSQITDAVRVYGAFGTSFRAPTLYERFIYFGDPGLDPERGETWEIGADARFAAFGQTDGVELSLIYRHSAIDDLIDFNASFSYANVDRAEIDNAEARIALRPAPWLTARAGYVATDAEDVAAGMRLLRRPDNVWTASVEATHGSLSGTIGWRRISARADQIYGDDGFWLGVGESPSYQLWRASAAWSITPAAQLYLAAENLADETYESVNGFAGAPRAIMIGLRLRPQR